MTLKEAKKEAINTSIKMKRGYSYLTISKQKEIGWYSESKPTQRTVFWVNKNGSLKLYDSDFARNYQRKYFPNIKLVK